MLSKKNKTTYFLCLVEQNYCATENLKPQICKDIKN